MPEAGGGFPPQRGPPRDGLYVVTGGEIGWTRLVGAEEIFVVRLGEGSIFAELIMVLDAPYPTTGRATTDTKLLKLNKDSFWEMLRVCPEVLRGILATSVERAELHESVSQQHAKLISLGTMAAGLAHELNNPAAAAGRSVKEAREVFRASSAKAIGLGALEMGPEERRVVAGLPEEVAARAASAGELDSLDRSDLEDEVALWLEDRGVVEAWDLSPTLVGAGLDAEWLDELEGRLPESVLRQVAAWLASEAAGEELLREIQHASNRISELVGAVKF